MHVVSWRCARVTDENLIGPSTGNDLTFARTYQEVHAQAQCMARQPSIDVT